MKIAALFALALPALASCGVGTPVYAHQAMSGWTYPLACCADNDCAQVAPETVKETAQGYVVTIAPGTHPMWRADRPAPLVVRIPYRDAKVSPDGRWHICLNGAGDLLCFFSAQGGS